MPFADRLMTMTPDWLLASAPPISNLPLGGGGAGAPAGGQPAAGGSAPTGPGSLGMLMPMLLAFFLFMIVMQIFAGRKQRKQRAEMMSLLRKHDKVRMIGGIIGTIAEIHDDEVVIKVDEATNTRIRFAKDAVQTVITAAPGSHTSEPEAVG